MKTIFATIAALAILGGLATAAEAHPRSYYGWHNSYRHSAQAHYHRSYYRSARPLPYHGGYYQSYRPAYGYDCPPPVQYYRPSGVGVQFYFGP